MIAVVPLAAADKLSELRQKADALHAGGKNDSALIVAREALDVAQKSRNTTAIVGINSSMGVYLRTMGKTDEALRHYNEAMKLCTTAEFKAKADEDARQEAAALYLNLATLHIDMQHKKEAMYYAGLSVDWTQKCADKAFKAQKKAELAETRMYVSTGLLVVAVLAALAVVYIMRQRRKARMQAEEFRRLQADTDRRLMQKYVDGLENERERLARELHDGVCNSLYTVQLKIAAGNGDAAGQAAMLDDCREQVRRISHEMMPPEFSYADISMVLDDYLCQAAGAGQCEITYEAVPEDAGWPTLRRSRYTA